MTKNEALKLALEVLEGLHRDPKGWWNFHVEITAIKKALAQPEQEPVTLENNLALTIAGDATAYRELVWKLSEKVMGVAMSSEPVKGKVNRVQVTAEAMSDLRRFVEKGVTERLAFNDKLFDTHKDAAWKLNATTPTTAPVG